MRDNYTSEDCKVSFLLGVYAGFVVGLVARILATIVANF